MSKMDMDKLNAAMHFLFWLGVILLIAGGAMWGTEDTLRETTCKCSYNGQGTLCDETGSNKPLTDASCTWNPTTQSFTMKFCNIDDLKSSLRNIDTTSQWQYEKTTPNPFQDELDKNTNLTCNHNTRINVFFTGVGFLSVSVLCLIVFNIAYIMEYLRDIAQKCLYPSPVVTPTAVPIQATSSNPNLTNWISVKNIAAFFTILVFTSSCIIMLVSGPMWAVAIKQEARNNANCRCSSVYNQYECDNTVLPIKDNSCLVVNDNKNYKNVYYCDTEGLLLTLKQLDNSADNNTTKTEFLQDNEKLTCGDVVRKTNIIVAFFVGVFLLPCAVLFGILLWITMVVVNKKTTQQLPTTSQQNISTPEDKSICKKIILISISILFFIGLIVMVSGMGVKYAPISNTKEMKKDEISAINVGGLYLIIFGSSFIITPLSFYIIYLAFALLYFIICKIFTGMYSCLSHTITGITLCMTGVCAGIQTGFISIYTNITTCMSCIFTPVVNLCDTIITKFCDTISKLWNGKDNETGTLEWDNLYVASVV